MRSAMHLSNVPLDRPVVEVPARNNWTRSTTSDCEVVEDPVEDEGYASADPEEPEASQDNGKVDEEAVPLDEWPATDEEVDANGNLRGFIDDEAEESGDDGDQDMMDIDGKQDADSRCAVNDSLDVRPL